MLVIGAICLTQARVGPDRFSSTHDRPLRDTPADSCAAAADWLLISVITDGLCRCVVCSSVVASEKPDGAQRASGREPTERESFD